VDKLLNMHRIGCAKIRLLKTWFFFSNIGASRIQALSSMFLQT